MLTLIAPKAYAEFTPEEYHEYVRGMYQLPKGKKESPASGLTISQTKKGAPTVRRSKTRPFAYVTVKEITALSKTSGMSQSSLWNMFKQKKYIIAKDRMEAEQTYADIQEIPW